MKFSFLTVFLAIYSVIATAGPGHSSGPAHPSAFLCKKIEGEQVFAPAPGGTIEYCLLDEAKINSMTLWYSLNGQMELAAKTYLASPLKAYHFRNAEEYCYAVGGEPQTLISYNQKVRSDECIFNEMGHLSMIDQETLFRGPNYPGNQRLTQLLTEGLPSKP